jgi:hypothetical protein
MKNPVFIDRDVVDMLGTHLKRGDIIAYSSKHAMRIAIYLGILINKKGDPSIALVLVNDDSEVECQIIVIGLPDDPHYNGKTPEVGTDTTITIDKGLFLDDEFHINNKIIQNAMKVLDNLKDDGLIN